MSSTRVNLESTDGVLAPLATRVRGWIASVAGMLKRRAAAPTPGTAIATAYVLAVEVVRHDGVLQNGVTYAFDDATGRAFDGHLWDGTRRLAPGDVVRVFYDPHDPRRNGPVDAVCGTEIEPLELA